MCWFEWLSRCHTQRPSIPLAFAGTARQGLKAHNQSRRPAAIYPYSNVAGVTRLGGVTPSFTAMMLSATAMPIRRLAS